MKRIMRLAALLFAAVSTLLPFAVLSASTPVNAPRVPVKQGTSTNWSGYAVETKLGSPQSHVVTDVKGQWVVPSVTCGATNTFSSVWVGIDGYSDSTVEQTGTEQDCTNGQPSYSAWTEMYPRPSSRIGLGVKAGDTIFAEVAVSGNGNFTLTLSNLTTRQNYQTTGKSNKAQRSSAEWIVEAPWSGGVLPLADFGTVQITKASATLNGHTGTISDGAWQDDRIDMVNSSNVLKDSTSSLGSGGSSFSVTWKSN